MVYALDSVLQTHGASFLSAGLSAMFAVYMNDGCTMKAFESTFSGWVGSWVILTDGVLEMDACDLRGRYVCNSSMVHVEMICRCSSKITIMFLLVNVFVLGPRWALSTVVEPGD